MIAVTGWLALATIRSRVGSFVAAFVALLCAAALITACGTLLETGLLGTVATERYAGSPSVVSADRSRHLIKSNGKTKSKPLTEHAWIDTAVLDRLHDSLGTSAAIGELTFTAWVVTPNDPAGAGGRARLSWGHAWTSAVLTPFRLAQGHRPSTAHDVVIDPRLAREAQLGVGSAATVLTAGGRASYTVAGITDRALADQTSLFFTEQTAQRLARRPDQYFAIGFPPAHAPDPAQLRAALHGTDARIATGRDRGTVEFTDVARSRTTLVSVAGVLVATSALVAALVVVGTFALSIAQRRRELALLRAVAATPRQIRRLIGWEAVVVGVLACLPGCTVGVAMASWLRSQFVAFGGMPPNMALHRSPVPVAAAVVGTVLAGLLAARVSARRTTRIRPTQALAEAAVEPDRLSPFRLVAGLSALGGQLTLLVVLAHLHTDAAAGPVTLLCALLAVLAVALLGPVISRLAGTILGPALRAVSARAGYLAAANNRTNARRAASIITPIMLATTFAMTILFTPTTTQHAAAAQRRDGLRADAVIVGRGHGVPANVVATATRGPGITAVTAEMRRTVLIGQDKYPATAATPDGLPRTLDLDVRAGSTAHLAPDEIAVSRLAADQHDVHVGQHLPVTLGDGVQVQMTVAAVYARGLGFGDVVLPLDVLSRHVDQPLADDVLVRGGDPAVLRRALSADSEVRVLDAQQFRAGVTHQQATTARIGDLAMSLVIAFAAIAVVNTLAMATVARGQEFAALRLVGVQRRQIRVMVYLETLAAALIALALGAGFAIAILTAFAGGMTPGYPPHAPLPIAALIGGAALLLVTLGTALPVRAAMRADPTAVATD